jgi:hypothetical protein
MLDAERSAALRDRLAAELSQIYSTEEAANWAHRVLAAKNTLTAADAVCIEEAFRAQLAIFAAGAADGPQQTAHHQINGHTHRGKKRRSRGIDKSVLTLPAPRRVRDREHVRYVTRQSCLICGRRPSDAHHLRYAQNTALSRKVSDEFTIPLCRGHHREVHRSGDEAMWWKKTGIDPTPTARALWLQTHPLPAGSDKMESEEVVANNIRGGRQPRKRGSNGETKPIEKAAVSQ